MLGPSNIGLILRDQRRSSILQETAAKEIIYQTLVQINHVVEMMRHDVKKILNRDENFIDLGERANAIDYEVHGKCGST